ncbi:glycosyltransferase family 2 protein [Acetatifactor muris]|uniref:glycosyltransferase family 2 protein n=1 Tax=Acetatifactor muris TaxID=879566 RepID=UPI0023F26D94|nr:glycosyltransferase [Acetatifactor muris]
MKLSIIVPVYNVEEYIDKCMDSLVKINCEDFEIICVNDGSTDNSLEKLEKYKKGYPDLVKVYTKHNGGLSEARNYGLKNASGSYIGFVDSDDWVNPEVYSFMLERAEREDADIAIADYMEIYPDKNIEKRDVQIGNKFVYEATVCNKIFKKNLFKNIRFPVGLWYEDNAVTYKLLFLAEKIIKVNRVMYYYRRNRKGSIMTSQKNPKIYDMEGVAASLTAFFSIQVLSPQDKEDIEYLFIRNVVFRQLPKIVLLEFPHILTIKNKIKNQYKILEKSYPEWYQNRLLINDDTKYFYGKIGKNHIKKLVLFKKSLFLLLVVGLYGRLKRKNEKA